LFRPERFEKTIRLEIPNKQKRIEILKHYSKNIGFEAGMNWDYLGNMTAGFTPADISSAMNQSSINAILQKLDSPFSPKHTIDTVEKGIEVISRERANKTLSSLESKILNKATFFENSDYFIKSLTEKGRIEDLKDLISPNLAILRSHLVEPLASPMQPLFTRRRGQRGGTGTNGWAREKSRESFSNL